MPPISQELKQLKPILRIEAAFSHHKRMLLKHLLAALSFIFMAVWLFLPTHIALTEGLFFIFFSLFLVVSMYESFFFSMYVDAQRKGEFSYELADILLQSAKKNKDAVNTFLESKYGKNITLRLNISLQEIYDFITLREGVVLRASQFEIKPQHAISQYVEWLFDNDKAFADFLFSFKIQKQQLVGAATWIEDEYSKDIQEERWWSKEKLDRIPGLGKNWAYGEIYVLDRYAEDMSEKSYLGKEAGLMMMNKEADDMSIILSRGREANVLIISDEEGERVSLVECLSEKIQSGIITPILEHKRVYLLRGESILQAHPTKSAFEEEWQNLLLQTVRSGNTILAIEDFAGFLRGVENIGSDFVGLMSPFLTSSNIQLIGLVNNQQFHATIESNQSLLSHFEIMRLEAKNTGYLFELLRDEAIEIEKKQGVFFTYQALEEIVADAEKYFIGSAAIEKMLDLLIELVPRVYAKGKVDITREDVLELVEAKTGVPVSVAKNQEEKTKLLNLENILHERIIGQDDAVTAISQALRRARSGLANAARPLGSFLFLGPTGVGKTETTKALTDVFFGDNSPMIRFDMSEYAGNDGLAKLIGSFGTSSGVGNGNLVNALREHQYGVLLLDEFEKANEEVLNIFLQILDEGMFSDAKGQKVNVRNMMIIATSNAGSSMIFNFVKEGGNIDDHKNEIIDTLIHDHMFKPELINRFDGVIVFQPLNRTDIEKIAKLKVNEFAQDLKKKGYNLLVTDALISFLVNKGFDQKFGARPMNRAISDEIQETIARSILKNELVPGSTFTLTQDTTSGYLLVSFGKKD